MGFLRNRFMPRTSKEAFRVLTTLTAFIALTGAAILEKKELLTSIDKYMDRNKGLAIIGILWLLTLLLILIRIRIPEKADRILSWLYAILSVPFIFLICEMITAEESRGSWLQKVFGTAVFNLRTLPYNLLLVGMTVLLFTVLSGSFLAGPSMAGSLLIVFTVANAYVTSFRGNGITFADFAVADTALEVAGGYTYVLGLRIFLGILFFILYRALGTKLMCTKLSSSWKKYFLKAACGLLVVGICLRVFVFSSWLGDHGIFVSYFNTMRSYRANGIPVTLARTVQDSIPRKPEGYSPEAAARIAAGYRSDSAGAGAKVPSGRTPNVIIIIDEAFSDLQLVGSFETTQDEMPFLRSLKENCIRGTTYASIRGGHTANSEFEFLTGHTMGMLPPETVPFQIYIRGEHPSMATLMAEQGYCGIAAFHPWNNRYYRRDKVYPLLGFDTFYHRKNCPIPLRKLRGFTSDESDFENLIALYEQYRSDSDAPWFFYNMTVQSHSPFDVDYDNCPTTVMPVGLSEEYKDAGQYLSLVKASDESFEKVIDYFSALEEPTVILFTGDHQPKLSNHFFNEIAGSNGNTRGVEGNMILYQVPFWIWANFDIKEEEGILTSYNYLQTLVLQSYGAPLTGYQKFLSHLREDVPVINAFGYYTADGTFYETDDKTSPCYEKVQEYFILEYNCLFDSSHRLEGFYDLLPAEG